MSDEEYVPGQPDPVEVEPLAVDEDRPTRSVRVSGHWLAVGGILVTIVACAVWSASQWYQAGESNRIPIAAPAATVEASMDGGETVTATMLATLHVTATESAVVTSKVPVRVVQIQVRTVTRPVTAILPAHTVTATTTARVVVPTTVTATRTLPRATTTIRVTRTLPRATVTKVIVVRRTGR